MEQVYVLKDMLLDKLSQMVIKKVILISYT